MGGGKTDVLFNYVLECGNLLILARDAARTSQNTSSVLVSSISDREYFVMKKASRHFTGGLAHNYTIICISKYKKSLQR